MTRYFYTDPLAAAWMAKHFGMCFLAGKLEHRHHADLSAFDCWPEPDDTTRFFIHPGSLHILEPRPADMVTNTFHGNKGRECSGLIARLINDDRSAVITTCERHNGKHHFVESVCQLRILQRDGKPFFWPEAE